MVFPLIPIVCLSGVIGGIFAYSWYESLPAAKRREADEYAASVAKRLYSKAVDELTRQQLNHVMNHVKKLMG